MATALPKRSILQPRSSKQGPHTVEAEGSVDIPGESRPRRHPSAKTALREEPEPGIATVFDILRRSARKFGDANAIGSRRAVDTHAESEPRKDASGKTVNKQWTYYQLSDYEYISFRAFQGRALTVGSAMRNLGLMKQDRVEIYAATSPFWFTVAHGMLDTRLVGKRALTDWLQVLRHSQSPSLLLMIRLVMKGSLTLSSSRRRRQSSLTPCCCRV